MKLKPVTKIMLSHRAYFMDSSANGTLVVLSNTGMLSVLNNDFEIFLIYNRKATN